MSYKSSLYIMNVGLQYSIYKYWSLSLSCLHFFDGAPWCMKALKFDDIQLIYFFVFLYFWYSVQETIIQYKIIKIYSNSFVVLVSNS